MAFESFRRAMAEAAVEAKESFIEGYREAKEQEEAKSCHDSSEADVEIDHEPEVDVVETPVSRFSITDTLMRPVYYVRDLLRRVLYFIKWLLIWTVALVIVAMVGTVVLYHMGYLDWVPISILKAFVPGLDLIL